MQLRIAIVIMFYLFINQILVCQTQVGIVDLDSITHYWMEELGLVEIKKNYQEKLRELGRKELKFLQEKYLQINTCPEQRLTKDEIRKEQKQLENDQKRIKALELYPEVLNQDFEEIQEHLKYVLMNELNSVGNLENRIFLDKEAIIYAENPKVLSRVNDKVSKDKITSKIETLLMDKLKKARGFIDSYGVLSK